MEDLPSRWFYVGLIVWLVAFVALIVATNATIATYMLAGSMIVLAGMRACFGPRVVPHIRTRWFDVVCLLVVALVLVYLAPWGSTPML